jgi:proton-dependent oligopeptide transporter, POT family
VAGQVLDPERALSGYAQVFSTIGLIAIGLGVALAAGSFWLKRLGHGRAEDQAPRTGTGPEQDAKDLL